MKYLGELTGAGVVHDKKGSYLAIEIDGETHLLYTKSKTQLDRLVMSAEDYTGDVMAGDVATEHP